MGSAAAYHLAHRGRRVVGIDRYAPPHELGSSHGGTRIIREAYYENPRYVPLVRRALELWRELEDDAGVAGLLVRNGGLTIGPPDGELVGGVLASAREHDVDHEVLGAAELAARFPFYVLAGGDVAVLEPGAGFVRPEPIIRAHLTLARQRGAELVTDTRVTGWRASSGGVRVETANGMFEADHLVIAAGAGAGALLPELGVPLTVERQVSHWFAPADPARPLHEGRMPVTMWEVDGRIFYSTPDVGHGVKVGYHHGGETGAPDSIRRDVSPNEADEARALLDRLCPPAAGKVTASLVCLYTNTPDQHFLIDTHPGHGNVHVVSACSGHGFKFSAAIGEAVADAVERKPPRVDLTPFRLRRFAV
jgi:sarcosine oxidase